jgi:ABC-2 type transport system ATP-binding protein
MNLLSLQNVNKSFDSKKIVKNLNLEVPSQSIYGLLGPNGAGKTTTIRMIMNIIAPDSGEIRVWGEPISEKSKEKIGYLPEERGLYRKMKVKELLFFFAKMKGESSVKLKAKVDSWLDRLELLSYKEKKVEELSKGMQQKLQFIATVLHEPDLLILDEPFAGLDPINVNLLKDIMLELKNKGATLIFSTHMMEHAEKLCDYICLIDQGEKVLDGKLFDIKAQFGKNTIMLNLDGDTQFLSSLAGIKKINDFNKYVEIKLEEGTNPQDILKSLVEKVQINRFEIVEPSLYDIFLETVGRSSIHPEEKEA